MGRRSPWIFRSTLIGALALAGVITAQHRTLVLGEARLSVSPTGYEEIVRRALTDNLKLVDEAAENLAALASPPGTAPSPAGEPAPLALLTQLPRFRIELTNLTKTEKLFVSRSFLPDDLADIQRFDIRRDRKPRLRSGFRSRPLPFSEDARWRGAMRFRPRSTLPQLRTASGRVLRFSRGSGDGRLVPVPLIGGLPGDALSGEGFRFNLYTDSVFTIHAVPAGDGTVSIVFGQESNPPGLVRLNQVAVEGAALRVIRIGDRISYERESGETVETIWFEQGASETISEFRRRPQGFARAYPDSAGLETFAAAVSGSMDNTIRFLRQALARNRGRKSRELDRVSTSLAAIQPLDLDTTLDLGIQSAAHALLSTQVHKRMPARGWSVPARGGAWYPRPPARAGLAILEIESGDLLAAASYPQRAHLDDYRAALRGAAESPQQGLLVEHAVLESSRRQSWLEGNHNLSQHQIGSVVKPLFGAAVALDWRGVGPDPLRHSVSCSGQVHWSSGSPNVPLVPNTEIEMAAYQLESHGDIDFEAFLARSCNEFMFQLGVQSLVTHPEFSLDRCDGGLGEFWNSAVAGTVLDRFHDLTGAELKDEELRGPEAWQEVWWAPHADTIRATIRDELGCGQRRSTSFAGASPRLLSLDILSVSTCHPDYSSFLKGGGSNRWTNLDLVVAFARLFSGRRMGGRVILGPPLGDFDPRDPVASLADPDYVERFEQTRSKVMRGMSRALTDRGTGTARRIRTQIGSVLDLLANQTGRQWGAYAKTGSSLREITLPSAVDATLEVTQRFKHRLRVANFLLAFMQCESLPTDPRPSAAPYHCNRAPTVGTATTGFVLHLWSDGVDGLKWGSNLAALYDSPQGRSLFEALGNFVEAH